MPQSDGTLNIGAGTITCNFDGKTKHPTEIGDETFIGSDTNAGCSIEDWQASQNGCRCGC